MIDKLKQLLRIKLLRQLSETSKDKYTLRVVRKIEGEGFLQMLIKEGVHFYHLEVWFDKMGPRSEINPSSPEEFEAFVKQWRFDVS